MIWFKLFTILNRSRDGAGRIASRNRYIGVETWRVCLTNLKDGIKVEVSVPPVHSHSASSCSSVSAGPVPVLLLSSASTALSII
jgi:hypothetical protein